MRGSSRTLLGLSLTLIMVFFITGCVTHTQGRFVADADQDVTVGKYTDLGLRYIQRGDLDKARRPLKRALEIDPQSPDAYNALAILLQLENDAELANEYFLKALDFAPDYTRVRNNYAAFLFGQKRYKEACEQLELATKDVLYDQRSAAYENLGVCFLKRDMKNQALAAFDRAIVISDMQPRALIEAASIYYERGDTATSHRYHEQYQRLIRLQLVHNSPRSLLLGVWLARANGDDDREASYRLMLRSMFPQSEEYQKLGEGTQP